MATTPNTITSIFFFLFIVVFVTNNTPCEAQLSSTFYDGSCPNALRTIRTTIRTAISRERRMAASIIRLHFHDCFVQGCDTLISTFDNNGLSARDMVALSGAHTIGQSQCFLFRDRIYNNGSDIDAGFASTRRRGCPANGGDGNLAPLDLVTPNSFDNNYFKNLIQKKGLLESDQVLFSGGSTDSIVREYSNNPSKFKSDFATAMVKMSEIRPLTGQEGVIRRICGALP
ncbi:hypothetical protein R6Q59_002601 [Mikania micrantha]